MTNIIPHTRVIMLCGERSTTCDTITNVLNDWPSWGLLPIESRANIVTKMERGIHAKTIDICDENNYEKRFDSHMFVAIYSITTTKLLTHLSYCEKNKVLFDNVVNETINAQLLANMSVDELCPSANDAIRAKLELRKNQKLQKNFSTLYTCGKCHKSITTIKLTQTRSADEGITAQIKCETCGNTWRQS